MQFTPEALFEVEIYSHFFRVITKHPRGRGVIYRFSAPYIQMDWIKEPGVQGKARYLPVKSFFSKTADEYEFRFLTGQYEPFLEFLSREGISPSLYTVKKIDIEKQPAVNIKITDGWELRDLQKDVEKFILEPDPSGSHSRLVAVCTGGGKTVSALISASKKKEKVVVFVLPKYVDKWCDDISTITKTKKKEIMVIQGSGPLKGLIQMAKDSPDDLHDFTVISLVTFRNFIQEYEEKRTYCETDSYGIRPDEFLPLIQAGVAIVDEAHEHLHAIFKLMLYMRVNLFIALSGTFLNDDSFITKMQHVMFPTFIRHDKIKMEKYVECYPVAYNIADPVRTKIRTTEFGSNSYSQTAFEKSIMKNPVLLKKYVQIIDQVIEFGYIRNRTHGDRGILFVGTVAMATYMTAHLKELYPTLDIRRYVAEDPYENVIVPDFRVTTVLSSGAAIDIANLIFNFMTTSMSSTVSNYQTLGRCRKLKDKATRFFYLYCSAIPKHVAYHFKKKEIFKDRVAFIRDITSSYSL